MKARRDDASPETACRITPEATILWPAAPGAGHDPNGLSAAERRRHRIALGTTLATLAAAFVLLWLAGA